MKYLISSFILPTSLLLAACGSDSDNSTVPSPSASLVCSNQTSDPLAGQKAKLGEQLFFDTNLSRDKNQSCATCHNPQQGFIDGRINDASTGNHPAPASLGSNGHSIGDRNAPTAAYAAFSPSFCRGERERSPSQQTSGVGEYQGYLGGQFWDGRAKNLAAQAGGPPLNPLEMAMPDKASVVARIQENQDYIQLFQTLYGADIFTDNDAAYAALADAIGQFERKDKESFYPFNSKYDRWLSGDYQYDPDSPATTGKTRFFSSDFSCSACHQLRSSNRNKGEIFTSFEYHNIGVPENTSLRAVNGVAEDFVDLGLALNPMVAEADKAGSEGKFKVPTLRNIAVTAPYMHNGVFNDLKTVILFYQHAKERALNKPFSVVNPETGVAFRTPEVDRNISDSLLAGNDTDINEQVALEFECFLLTLTDQTYEHLLDTEKVEQCGI